jgi:hypothetical protein
MNLHGEILRLATKFEDEGYRLEVWWNGTANPAALNAGLRSPDALQHYHFAKRLRDVAKEMEAGFVTDEERKMMEVELADKIERRKGKVKGGAGSGV